MTVYVSISPGRGMGLFAARDIKKDELVSYYPLEDYNGEEEFSMYFHRIKGQNVTGKPWSGPIDVPLDSSSIAAHIINDYACITFGPPDEQSLYIKCIKYLIDSLSHQNVYSLEHESNAYYALTSIKAGEELFHIYGINYWFGIIKVPLIICQIFNKFKDSISATSREEGNAKLLKALQECSMYEANEFFKITEGL